MKMFLIGSLIFGLGACGTKEGSEKRSKAIEEQLGIASMTKCSRAEEVTGMNSVFRRIPAPADHLQDIMINISENTVQYVEARTDGSFTGVAPFTFNQRNFHFKTTSKALKLFFPQNSFGRIADDTTEKEYAIAHLHYDDGSGYRAYFLCTAL